MSEVPERIWMETSCYTLHVKTPNIVWEPQWKDGHAQAFNDVRKNGVEYVRADVSAQEKD